MSSERFEEIDDGAEDLGPDPFRKLFGRWEHQPWEALGIDLTRDRATWGRLPTPLRSELGLTIQELGGGDVAVTRLLIPLIEGAPFESWRLYLTTQLSDEAKHAMFFRRYFEEVIEGQTPVTADVAEDFEASAFQTEFTPLLAAAVHAVDDDVRTWHRASTLYHLVTEGVLGVTVLRIGRLLSRNRGLLPGLGEGLDGVFRDESRHITFGRRAAQVGMAAGHGRVIADAYVEGVAAAARVMVGPDREEVALSERAHAQRGANRLGRLEEARRRALRQGRVLGLPFEEDELEAAWATACERAVEDYETRFGVPHSLAGAHAAGRDLEGVRGV